MKKRSILFIILSLVIIGSLFFSSMPVFASGNNHGKNLENARKALEDKIFGMPGFAGIAHSEENGEIIVFLEDGPSKAKIPDVFEGCPVRKLVTGRFKALGTQLLENAPSTVDYQISSDRTGVVRPLVGGISLSANVSNSPIIYAGTLGMVTYDNKILTNAHVIAMDPNNANFLKKGTPVIQPGSLDEKTQTYHPVGTLSNYVSLRFGLSGLFNPNYVDAAIANINTGVTGSSGWQYGKDSSYGNYQVLGYTNTVQVGNIVRKSGRTTGVTESNVTSVNASVIVYYTSNKWAYYKDQIIVNNPNQSFLNAGDSGSCVDYGGKFVGLAFAGSTTQAIVCKASRIISALGIKVN